MRSNKGKNETILKREQQDLFYQERLPRGNIGIETRLCRRSQLGKKEEKELSW